MRQLSGPRHGRVAIVALAVALSLLAAACGGSDDDGASKSGANGELPKDEGQPKRGGKAVYGLEAESSGGYCLPSTQLAISGIMVVGAIYDTLTIQNEKYEFVPYLAKTLTPSADFKTWEMTLRENVKFHNGEPLDAEAVRLNLEKVRTSFLGSFTYNNIADVVVTGPLSLTITTRVPWPALPAYLTGGGRFGIAAPAQLNDTENCPRNLIGTGPFKFKEWVVNDHLGAVRNPDYWQPGLPYLDEIEFRPVIENATRLNGVKAGQLQISHTSSAEGIVSVRRDAQADRLNNFESGKAPETGYVMFNVTKSPFDDIRARQAAAYAANVEEINNILGQGIFKVANGPFSESVVGYAKDTGFPTHNLDRAKQLVQQYEADKGELRFTLFGTLDPGIIRVAQLLKSQMEKAGMSVDLQQLEQAQLISTALSGGFQATLFRNHAGVDPDYQYVWWKSGSPVNFGRFSDPEIDRILDAGRSETNRDRRAALYRELDRRFGEQVWNIWLTHQLWSIFSRPEVKGVGGPELPGGGRRGIIAGLHPTVGLWIDE